MHDRMAESLDDIVASVHKEMEWIKQPLIANSPRPNDSRNHIASTPPATWSVFAEGYRFAAEEVFASIGGSFPADFDVYPRINLWRHALDLERNRICLTDKRFT